MAKPDDKKPAANAAASTTQETKSASAPPVNGNVPKPSFEKKITTKVLGFNKVALQKMVTIQDGDNAGENNKQTPQLYSIIGICTGAKVGESQYGGWIGFTGQFEATRFSDGARFVSPVAFIPEPASGMMASAIDQAGKAGRDVDLRFAFIIGVKWSSAAIGYEYYVEPVLKASENDALADLRAQMSVRIPQLTHQN